MTKWVDDITKRESQEWNARQKETAKYPPKKVWKDWSSHCRRCSLFFPDMTDRFCDKCSENMSIQDEYKRREDTYEGPKRLDEPLFSAAWIRERIKETISREGGSKSKLAHVSGVPARMIITITNGKQEFVSLSVGDRILIGLGLLGPPPEEAWAGMTMREVYAKHKKELGKKRTEAKQLSLL